MLSIIIPILNEQDMSHECIHAVLENTTGCEIIVIDNGSDIPFKPPFSGFIETTIIRNESNLGFPVAVNQGIRAAKGDMIVLLNNDVIVPPGWSQRLADWLNTFSIVAPMTNYCAGLQQITIPVYENTAEFYKEAVAFSGAYDGEAEEVNFVIGFCMAFKKSLWEEIGLFDESLWPCSGEEIDFCYDKETQTVTRNGMKYFRDLTLDDELITRNDEGIIEFQHPEEIISRHEKTLIHFKGKSINIKCSKKQHLLVGYERKGWKYKAGISIPIKFVTAEDINNRLWKNQDRYYVENASGEWEGTPADTISVAGREWKPEVFVDFMAWFLSEGYVQCDQEKRRVRRDNQIRIDQHDNEKYEQIYNVLVAMDIKPNRHKTSLTFSDKHLCAYLAQFGKSWEKYVPKEIKNLPSLLLRRFLDVYAKGDGNRARTGKRITWYTASDKMKDDIVELLIKTRQPFTVWQNKGGETKFKNGVYNCRPVWNVQSCFATSQGRQGRVSLKPAKEVHYDDITYDVRIPNRRIYVIRNGKGCWSSNCLRARAAGHTVGIARDIYVHHFGSRTFDALQKTGQIDYAKIVARNDKHLAEKWGKSFWEQQGIANENM